MSKCDICQIVSVDFKIWFFQTYPPRETLNTKTFWEVDNSVKVVNAHGGNDLTANAPYLPAYNALCMTTPAWFLHPDSIFRVLLIFELSWVLFTFCVMDEKWGCATPKEKFAGVKNSVIVEHQPRKFSLKNFRINFVRVANKRQVWRQVNLSFIFLILDRMLTQKDFYLEVQRATQVKPGKLKFAFLSYEFKIKWNFQGRKIVKWAWFGASVINNFN